MAGDRQHAFLQVLQDPYLLILLCLDVPVSYCKTELHRSLGCLSEDYRVAFSEMYSNQSVTDYMPAQVG